MCFKTPFDQVQAEIKNKDGNYLMLGDLVTQIKTKKHDWNLGRETLPCLEAMKERGDRSAHNPTSLGPTKQRRVSDDP